MTDCSAVEVVLMTIIGGRKKPTGTRSEIHGMDDVNQKLCVGIFIVHNIMITGLVVEIVGLLKPFSRMNTDTCPDMILYNLYKHSNLP